MARLDRGVSGSLVIQLPHAEFSHRRVIVIWPLVYAPEHEFEPLYVPVIVIVARLTCAVPVALDEHPDDIMLLAGMSIANVMSSPDMVPRKDPGVRPCMPEPEKLIGPVTVDPFSVSCHVIEPISACPIMLPAPIELLESDPMPAHVPAMDPDGAVEELPPHAAANDVNRTTANALFILPTSSFAVTRRTISEPFSTSEFTTEPPSFTQRAATGLCTTEHHCTPQRCSSSGGRLFLLAVAHRYSTTRAIPSSM